MDIPKVKYKLVFKKDNNEETCITFADKKSAIIQADSIAQALLNVCILRELNDMQSEVLYEDEHSAIFKNKFTIPDYFINLILQKYNMRICPFKENIKGSD